MFAALVRSRFPAEESRIDFTFDWAVSRAWEEAAIAEWMICDGLGSGGTRPGSDREVRHWSG